ncbi:unnamed protein product [Lampetra fluviatilis]
MKSSRGLGSKRFGGTPSTALLEGDPHNRWDHRVSGTARRVSPPCGTARSGKSPIPIPPPPPRVLRSDPVRCRAPTP